MEFNLSTGGMLLFEMLNASGKYIVHGKPLKSIEMQRDRNA